MDYKTAWLSAIDEYNNFGVAAHDAKHQIDKATANLMLGFKVRVDNCQLCFLFNHQDYQNIICWDVTKHVFVPTFNKMVYLMAVKNTTWLNN